MKKVAVITGTTSGIGKAIALYYKQEGFYVVGINRNKKPEVPNPVDLNLVFDLSYDCEQAVKAVTSKFTDISVLVNNAGAMLFDDLDYYLEATTINLAVPIYLCNELLGYIKPGGNIINIASVSGIVGDPDAPIYSACKAAIINLTRTLAKMAAPSIRVNCISPGFFNTNLVEGDTPQELIDGIPMKREAEPHELVPVINMLQKCKYITGANIVVDGGVSL